MLYTFSHQQMKHKVFSSLYEMNDCPPNFCAIRDIVQFIDFCGFQFLIRDNLPYKTFDRSIDYTN